MWICADARLFRDFGVGEKWEITHDSLCIVSEEKKTEEEFYVSRGLPYPPKSKLLLTSMCPTVSVVDVTTIIFKNVQFREYGQIVFL